jgi:hypothetical protein
MGKKQFKSEVEKRKNNHVVTVLQGWWKGALDSQFSLLRVMSHIHGASIFATDSVAEELVFLREILETLEDMKATDDKQQVHK